jgi:hypothetical protein
MRAVLRYLTSSIWAALFTATLTALASQLGLIAVTQSLAPDAIVPGQGYTLMYRFDQPIFRWRIFTFFADDPGTAAQSDLVLGEDGRQLGPPDSEQSLHLRVEPRIYRYLLVSLIILASLTIVFSNGIFHEGGLKRYIPATEVSLPPTSATKAKRDVLASVCLYGTGLLIILAVINCAELLKDRTNFRLQEEGRVPTISESVIYWKTRALLDGSIPDKDVVFVGDSSALMSIMPKQFTETTGLSSISLSSDASYTLEFQNRILDVYLRTHRSPRTIVAHLSYIILGSGSAPAGIALFLAQRDRGLNWLEDFEHNTRRSKFNLEGVSFYYSTKFLARKMGESLGFHFTDGALERPRGSFGSDTEVARFIKDSDGFLPNPLTGPQGGPAHVEGIFEFPEYMTPMLQNLFAIARDHGSRLVFVPNPLSEKYDTPANLGQLRRVETRLREIARDYDNVCFPEPAIRFYPDSEAWDNAHLAQGGVVKETRFLADAVTTDCGRTVPSH